MSKEKYGFVYIWYDKKHKRFYIGSHWGTEDDGYICSSTWMRNSFKRRPQDFKRRILYRTNNKNDLLSNEYIWLSKISQDELGSKYYNLKNHHPSHWFTDEEKTSSLKEKLSTKAKENHENPEYREKYLAGLKKRNPVQSEETKRKRSESMKKRMAEKFPPNTRKDSPEQKEKAKELSRIKRESKPKKVKKEVLYDENGKRILSDAQKESLKLGRKGGQHFTEEERKARSERAKAFWAAKKGYSSISNNSST